MGVASPVVELINQDTRSGLSKFKISIENLKNENDLITNFPTVYIHNWKNNDKFEVYVGESNDFFQRTEQHYEQILNQKSWQKNLINNDASLYVIAHEEFNKSLTLDIENRLIHYLSSSSSVSKVHNARGNPQNKYYPCEELNEIFSKIWRKLRTYNKLLFLSESQIKDSAIYKASPLHKLNNEQLLAKERILNKINECLKKDNHHQLILVEGDAGTGKTVLMSSMFYDLINKSKFDENEEDNKLETAIIVNHKEQLTVYEEIAKKLDLINDNQKVVFNPTQFINLYKDKKNSPHKRTKTYDVVFVDEAHLLLTQKNQAYIEEDNQIDEIIKYAKVVVAMYDRNQSMNAEQYLDEDSINKYINLARQNDSYIKLNIQMRMQVDKKIEGWIRNITDNCKLTNLVDTTNKYEIKIFDNPKDLETIIKNKASNKNTELSRLIATYDWNYSGISRPKNEKYWNVKIGNWKRPWNYELSRNFESKKKKRIKNLAWAEQKHTIDEIGSTYTIQGFDLNYAGVILGPSVKYKNGKIIFDSSESKNDKATHKRTLKNGETKSFGEEFLKNELRVLLTRGVNGLFIYACDDSLRGAFKNSLKEFCFVENEVKIDEQYKVAEDEEEYRYE